MRCNNATLTRTDDGAWSRSGDPSESALLVAAAQLGVDVAAIQAGRDARRRRLFAFDARLKRMATLDIEPGGQPQIHAKGAPLELLERCTSPARRRQRASARRRRRGRGAHRLRALRRRRSAGARLRRAAPGDEQRADDRDVAESGLCFLGLVALEDPPRPDVADAVARCHRAGIRIIVITGDHGLTAEAVAREVGIVGEHAQVVTGPRSTRCRTAA